MRVMVTGGAGFIGSALCRYLIQDTTAEVLNVDKLTYAGNLSSLAPIASNRRYHFAKADICDFDRMVALITEFEPEAIMPRRRSAALRSGAAHPTQSSWPPHLELSRRSSGRKPAERRIDHTIPQVLAVRMCSSLAMLTGGAI
jgi:nucleoside-diphosphate-sugar epimerase